MTGNRVCSREIRESDYEEGICPDVPKAVLEYSKNEVLIEMEDVTEFEVSMDKECQAQSFELVHRQTVVRHSREIGGCSVG